MKPWARERGTRRFGKASGGSLNLSLSVSLFPFSSSSQLPRHVSFPLPFAFLSVFRFSLSLARREEIGKGRFKTVNRGVLKAYAVNDGDNSDRDIVVIRAMANDKTRGSPVGR